MASPFTLAPLPYEESALEPVISARTIGFHYHKHHKTYVDTLNKLVEATRYAELPLEGIVHATLNATAEKDKNMFNNAGQVWNHDFYWRSLAPNSTKPSAKLKEAIERDFGGSDALAKQLIEAGKDLFGSGWVWLTSKAGKLAIEKTANAIDPMAKGVNCLLGIDVWEHAYYLDYQNERAKHLQTLLPKLINWKFASDNLEKEDHAIRAAAE